MLIALFIGIPLLLILLIEDPVRPDTLHHDTADLYDQLEKLNV